jgi:hypothetical protein
MKTLTIFATLWLVFPSPKSQAVIFDFKQIHIVFTNAADAQTNATWSEPDKITVSKEGLGWDGDVAASRDGWIQTKPVALGLSWRPTYAISVRAQIQPPPHDFTLSNGQKSTGDPGDMYVRYSPDLKHWSSWEALQRAEPQSMEEKKTPARYYSGTIRVPYRDRSEYGQSISQYSHMDVPWKSDEEAAVKWILNRDPVHRLRRVSLRGAVSRQPTSSVFESGNFIWNGRCALRPKRRGGLQDSRRSVAI